MTHYPDAFIRAIPKTDLHVHLDGSLRLPTLIELARERRVALPSQTEEGLNELVFKPAYRDLEEYLQGFAWTLRVMQDAEGLERTARELALDNWAEGVRYLEVRFAPQLHMSHDLDFALHTLHNAIDLRVTVQGFQSDINQAAEIQQALLPQFPPEFPGTYPATPLRRHHRNPAIQSS